MEMQRIRGEGTKAEQRFRQLVPFAGPRHSERSGDATVTVDGHEHHVEIKMCRTSTINQIRPIKFIVLAVYAPNRGCWYVVPPNDLVHIAARKDRGQHTEIPFECMNLTISQLDDQGFKCIDEDLPERVREAVRKGERDTETRKIMEELLIVIKKLNRMYKQKILRMIR